MIKKYKTSIITILILVSFYFENSQGQNKVKMDILYPDYEMFFQMTVLDREAFETVYRDHIKLFEEKNIDKIFLLLGDIKSEIQNAVKREKSSYYYFMSNYDGATEYIDAYFDTYKSSIYETIDYIHSSLYSSKWKENPKIFAFIRVLLYRDCLSIFQNEWYVEPFCFISKDLSNYLFTPDEYEHLFYRSRNNFFEINYSHGFFNDVSDKFRYEMYDSFFPYFILDNETLGEITKKLEQKPIPENELLQKEFSFYKDIFKKAFNKEWIILMKW